MTKELVTCCLRPDVFKQKELNDLIDPKILDALGLPSDNEPTVQQRIHTGKHATASNVCDYYIGTKKLEPCGRFKGGYPVVVFERTKKEWYVNGIEHKDRRDCSSEEEQVFFDKAEEVKNDPRNLVPAFSLGVLLNELVKQL